MLRSVLKLSVLVLSVVAIWLTLSQPNTAFAQNPTPAASSQTTIGPLTSHVVESDLSPVDKGKVLGLVIMAVGSLVFLLTYVYWDLKTYPSGKRKKGPRLPRNFN